MTIVRRLVPVVIIFVWIPVWVAAQTQWASEHSALRYLPVVAVIALVLAAINRLRALNKPAVPVATEGITMTEHQASTVAKFVRFALLWNVMAVIVGGWLTFTLSHSNAPTALVVLALAVTIFSVARLGYLVHRVATALKRVTVSPDPVPAERQTTAVV